MLWQGLFYKHHGPLFTHYFINLVCRPFPLDLQNFISPKQLGEGFKKIAYWKHWISWLMWIVTQKFSFCTNDLRYIYFFSGNKDVYLKKKEKKRRRRRNGRRKKRRRRKEEEGKKRKKKKNWENGQTVHFFADNCFTSPPPLSTLANIIIIIFALRNLLSTFTDPPHHTFTFSQLY